MSVPSRRSNQFLSQSKIQVLQWGTGGWRALSKTWWCGSMLRAWVSPEGELHEVSDADLYSFCTVRGLHYQNMLDHMERATSDHKNGGWRAR